MAPGWPQVSKDKTVDRVSTEGRRGGTGGFDEHPLLNGLFGRDIFSSQLRKGGSTGLEVEI